MVSGHSDIAEALLAAAGSIFLGGPAPIEAGCEPVWPTASQVVSAARPIDERDLLAIRDIGNPNPGLSGPSPLAISPDGSRVAFLISRADVAANRYCQALLVISLTGPPIVRVVDRGGERIRREAVVRGLRTDDGIPEPVIPAWSPDGRSIAYLKKAGDRVQAWRVELDGGARPITRSAVDVESVGWSRDGRRLVYSSRPTRQALANAFDREARSGYLYDERILPQIGPRPQLPGDLPKVHFAIPADGGEAIVASLQDVEALPPERLLGVPGVPVVMNAQGLRAGADPASRSPLAKRRVWAETANRHKHGCEAPACNGDIAGLWWRGDGREIIFLRREGWGGSRSALYRWVPGQPAVQSLLATDDRLFGCEAAATELICLRETARTPRQIVAIDMRSASIRLLFDSNPEFSDLIVPPVERIRWRNDRGLEAWGDLVLPVGTPPDEGWPLVIVQYQSEGFLRGGTGDEYPIYGFAARGLAVLSVQRPPLLATAHPEIEEIEAIIALTHKDWAERRSVHSSLMIGLDLVLARDDIDPSRVGITGLSDGSSSARFALVNAPRFAAAATSTCCMEPKTIMTYGGTRQADELRRIGFPSASSDGRAFWQPYSMALNADRMRTPLLMQLASDEYLTSLETFTALREHGQPVEMFVFPNEHHIKWQPAHRAAIYERNLDWFGFWLQGRIDPNRAKSAQYERWQAMRASLRRSSDGPSAP